MCGITGGVWTAQAQPLARETLGRMTELLRHRGPDDEGQYVSDLASFDHTAGGGGLAGVALGFRRLSILDVAGSQQPLSNEDGSVWAVFNGEIYNYRELRRRLEGAGHRFRTLGDSETLVHLYEDEGPDFVAHLEGMFALALWDARRRRLILARDRLGKKPLVYLHDQRRLLFASELKSLLAVPGVCRQLDPAALDEYLTYQYVPHPRTIFKAIRKLPPAHLAIFDGNQLEIRRYWNPDLAREVPLPAQEYRRQLRTLLTAAVEKRLQSDVPLGAFLSGGVDSSIVVGLMSGLLREPVRTFSIGFPVPEFDETRYAQEVASRFGTRHHAFVVEPDGLSILPKLVWHFDEPFADSSAVPTWYVSQLTRQHVTVALTGDGGDELFAGYDRYAAAAWAGRYDRLPSGVRNFLAAGWWQRVPASTRQKSFRRKLKKLIGSLPLPAGRRYVDWISIFNEARRGELYQPEFLATLPESDPYDFFDQALARVRGRDIVSALSLGDLQTYLPCDLLTKVDIASMAHSLECRAPFLDHHVVELAAAMPVELKFRRGRGKRILKETFADLLPESVQGRKKMGFGVPIDHWFRHELAEFTREMLLSERSLGRGYFRPEVVRQLVAEHQGNRFDHSYRLWALLILELWLREWVDGDGDGGVRGEGRGACPELVEGARDTLESRL